MKKLKFIILSFLFLFLLCLIFFFIKGNKFDFEKIVNTHSLNKNLVYNLSIDGFICPYDKKNSLFYYSNNSIPNSFTFVSDYDVSYRIYDSDDNLYKIIVYDDSYYDLISLYIDTVPIVNIYDMDIIKPYSNLNSLSQFNLSDFDETDYFNYIGVQITNFNRDSSVKSFSSLGSMSVRGASSTFFDKKSYKLDLKKQFGFNNVSKDRVWVLDALYTDASKIRNKLSSDIWNLFNDNQSINNDLHSEFVELFIDNEYMGLYVLKEKVDRSVYSCLDDGLLLKATSHLLDDKINKFLSNPHIVDDEILNFEIKKNNKEILDNFIDNMFVYYSSNSNYGLTSRIYNIDNFINYKLFVALISGEDNVSSNQYYSICGVDDKILITPWDMDLTWGLYWNLNTFLHSSFEYDKDFNKEWLDQNIINRMDTKTIEKFKDRYWELRRNVITMDTINSYLDSYKELLVNSGAASRDSERWYEYDVENEIETIREWAGRRIQFLDEYFS